MRKPNDASTLTASARLDEPEQVPSGRFVELPGRGTTFVRELSGPPGAPTVILLHGILATAGTNWLTTMKPLSERFRVLALDLRGHGRGPLRIVQVHHQPAFDVIDLGHRLALERRVDVRDQLAQEHPPVAALQGDPGVRAGDDGRGGGHGSPGRVRKA